MKNEYSVEVLRIINEAMLPYYDQIAQVAYYKTYKFANGCNMSELVYNNLLNEICNKKYTHQSVSEGDIMLAVCSLNGTDGLVFGINGIFYKKDMLSKPVYVEYANCKDISFFQGLENDKNFSTGIVKQMLCAIDEAVQIGTLRERSSIANLKNKFKSGNDYFAEGKEELDVINECIMSFYDADYSARYQRLGLFKFSEKKNLNKDWYEHSSRVERLIGLHNRKGSFDDIKYSMISETIKHALNSKYFFMKDFNEQYICLDKRKVKAKTLQMMSNYKKSLEYGFMRDTPEDYFVAFVDLSDGACKEGIVFKTSSMLIKYQKIAYAHHMSGFGFANIFFESADCYVGFGTSDIGQKIDPRKLNYVLDKIHKITEGKY